MKLYFDRTRKGRWWDWPDASRGGRRSRGAHCVVNAILPDPDPQICYSMECIGELFHDGDDVWTCRMQNNFAHGSTMPTVRGTKESVKAALIDWAREIKLGLDD